MNSNKLTQNQDSKQQDSKQQVSTQTVEKVHEAFQHFKDEADFVSFRMVSERTRDFTVRNAKPEDLRENYDKGLMIEVMLDGHIGYGATCDISTDGIRQAFLRAKAITKETSKIPIYRFDQSVRPPSRGSFQSSRKQKLDSLSISEIYDFLKKCSKELKTDDKIVTATASAMVVECENSYMSSVGAEFSQQFDMVVRALEARASFAGETQTRSFHGGRGCCLQIGAEYFKAPQELEAALEASAMVGKEAVELLSGIDCPEEVCDLVLAPDQMMLQIHESIGHPLEMDRILGDERNFAGWSFVKPEDFGQLRYGSNMMNVVFDPGGEQQFSSYRFDDVGHSAEKKYLIKDGVLIAGLGGLESQERLKLSGVANSRSSSWNRAPIDRMANINLEGGNLSLDQLLAQVERGVFMFANRSWSIDDYRRKFQFGCEYGRLIENGKLTKVVKNPNYRGITIPFWNSLAGLSSLDTVESYGSPYCGKGEPSQIIRVGHASPYALFKNIEVFGGGK